jgi:TPR repeat protein
MTPAKFTLHFVMILLLACGVANAQKKFSTELLAAARQGDADAQNELGIAYSEGLGVRHDQTKAVNWFRRSAEQGYSLGACNLGLHYGRGAGVRRDRTLMMKWVFAANALDGLRCQPGDYVEMFKPHECQIERGWEMAVAWLKTHPSFKNNHGKRPWLNEGQYPITLREQGSTTQLPPKRTRKCR